MARLPEDPDRTTLSALDVEALLEGEPDPNDPDARGPTVEGGIQGSKPGHVTVHVDATTSRKRREAMSSLLASGASEDQIVNAFGLLKLPNGDPGFNMGEAATLRLMNEVRDHMLERDRANKKMATTYAVQRHLKHIQNASAKGAYSAVAMLEKNLAHLQGTLVHRVEITTDIPRQLLAVLGNMDPEEAKQLIAEEVRLVERAPAGALPVDSTSVALPPEPDPELVKSADSAMDRLIVGRRKRSQVTVKKTG